MVVRTKLLTETIRKSVQKEGKLSVKAVVVSTVT